MSEIITLDTNSPPIQYLRKKDKRLAKVIDMVGPITYHTHEDNPYAFLIHEIIEQMLSAKVASKIYERFESLCGGGINPVIVNELSDADIKSIGTADTKVSYIRNLTSAVISGELNFETINKLPDNEAMCKLVSFRGIGNWTAKMYLLFVLDRPDVLPFEDVAFQQAFEWVYKSPDRTKEAIIKRCKKWKPYSSFAVRYMYRALDLGFTKSEFHLYK